MQVNLSDTQLEILFDLAYQNPASFSELKKRGVKSNRFAYHLKKLHEADYISKEEGNYDLTSKGEKLISKLSEEREGVKEQPILGVILIIQDEEKILCSKRKKEPFKGYSGLPHGRISEGEDIEDAASRIAEERTGINSSGEQVEGLWLVDTEKDGELLYSHYHFVVRVKEFSGEILNNTDEFENTWITEFGSKGKTFQGDQFVLENLVGGSFKIMKGLRSRDNKKIKKVSRDRLYTP